MPNAFCGNADSLHLRTNKSGLFSFKSFAFNAARAIGLFAGLLLLGNASPTKASGLEVFVNFLEAMYIHESLVEGFKNYEIDISQGSPAPEAPQMAGPTTPVGRATFRMINLGATTEPGEPSYNNRMQKTVWAQLKPDTNLRIVLHTYGSDYDTALAVHTGKKVNKLTEVAFNDDKPVAGISDTASLVQFDAAKGVKYRIQIGSKTGDENDVLLNAFAFPETGGLSMFLVNLEGGPNFGREFDCTIGDSYGNSCGDPTFLIHNSTGKTLKIVPSTDLGPGIAAPANFTLKPGKLATAAFTFEPGFDKTTIRTIAGRFSFLGKKNGKKLVRADMRGLITVKAPASSPDVLQMSSSLAVQGSFPNVGNAFEVALRNTGAFKARGCHARTEQYTFTRTMWQQTDPETGAALGEPNTPFDIPRGKTRTLTVRVGSMESRVADPTFEGVADVVIDCANTAPAPFDLRNNFDHSAIGGWELAKLTTKRVSPSGDKLKVPDGGEKAFVVSAKSVGADGTIIVRPDYAFPFEEYDPDKLFGTTICRLTGKGGDCLTPPGFGAEYETVKNEKQYFKVFVESPVTDPGYDPTKRRVFVKFMHKRPPGHAAPSETPVAAESIAPKVK